MAAPTLAFRVGILAGIVFGAVALIAVALAVIFFIGLASIPPPALAIGVLVFISLLAAIPLAIVFGAGALIVVVISLVLFLVVAFVAWPAAAVVAVLLFLVLLMLVRLAIGTPGVVPFSVLLLVLFLIPIGALLGGVLGPSGSLIVIAVLGYIALGIFVLWLLLNVQRMPIELLGLGGLRHMPGIPLASLPDFIEAAIRLKGKEAQRQIPIDAMTNRFELGAGTPHARTDDAKTFLFGGSARDDAQAKQYSLDLPSQYAMGWTTFERVDARAAALAPEFEMAFFDPDVAGYEWWKNITRYWGPFGIVPMRRVATSELAGFKATIGPAWNDTAMGALANSGGLYVLDMTIFAKMDPTNESVPRFTPATLAFFSLTTTAPPLMRSGMPPPAPTPPVPPPATPLIPPTPAPLPEPWFAPLLVQVSDGANGNTQTFTSAGAGPGTMNGWLYALQALKVSTTVWGIWCGHVYRYHIVTTAMQMTMFQRLPLLHPVRQVLGLQSKYTIGFDTVLLVDWSFPPPTSCGTSIQFLQLINEFAKGRVFNDDDPEVALAALGLPRATFSDPRFLFADVNLPGLAARLNAARTPPTPPTPVDSAAVFLLGLLPLSNAGLATYVAGSENAPLQTLVVADLNALVAGPDLTATITAFPGFTASPDTTAAIAALATANAAVPASAPAVIRALTDTVNRMLLQDAFAPDLWIMQWNLYPIARYVVSIYRIAQRYVGAVVAACYPNAAVLAADVEVHRWMEASGAALEGNIAGLPWPSPVITPPPFMTPVELANVLTSLIYRITAHGMARLAPVGNPGLTWIGNFPPCLQDSRIPDPANPAGTTPASDLTLAQLLAFMPRTGAMGEMIAFIFSFGFTDTFEPLIPVESANTTGLPDAELHPFVGLPPACDAALQAFRAEMIAFMRFFLADMNRLNSPAMMNFSATSSAIHHWEMNIEQ
jgi:hypothetical protein